MKLEMEATEETAGETGEETREEIRGGGNIGKRGEIPRKSRKQEENLEETRRTPRKPSEPYGGKHGSSYRRFPHSIENIPKTN